MDSHVYSLIGIPSSFATCKIGMISEGNTTSFTICCEIASRCWPMPRKLEQVSRAGLRDRCLITGKYGLYVPACEQSVCGDPGAHEVVRALKSRSAISVNALEIDFLVMSTSIL